MRSLHCDFLVQRLAIAKYLDTHWKEMELSSSSERNLTSTSGSDTDVSFLKFSFNENSYRDKGVAVYQEGLEGENS